MHEEPIFTTAVIREAITARAFRAELPNGNADSIQPGVRVRVALTPYDFDKARIEGLATEEPGD